VGGGEGGGGGGGGVAGGGVGQGGDVLGGIGQLLRGSTEVVPGPAGGRIGDASRCEQRLVVDHRQVVDEGGEPDDLASGRHDLLRRRVEVVPVVSGRMDDVRQVHRLAALGDVGGVGPVDVRDVGSGPGRERGRDLREK